MSGNGAAERTYGVAKGIVAALGASGVDALFFMTGGDQPLWLEARRAGMQLALARSEQSAVYMADGYARASGKPAAVYGQWGPGAANVAGALAEPWWAGTPVIALTSAVPTTSAHRHEYQQLEQLPLFTSVTKWSRGVTSAQHAAELTIAAVAAARSGRAGPVHLDLPRNVLAGEPEQPLEFPAPTVPVRPAAAPEAVTAILDALRSADRPAILAGSGVLLAGAEQELARLLDLTGLPVVTSPGGKGAVDERIPEALGVVGRYGRTLANECLRDADVVLVLGSGLSSVVTDGYRLPGPDCRILQVDIEAERIGRSRPAAVGVQADLKAALAALVHEHGGSPTGLWQPWLEETRLRRTAWHAAAEEAKNAPGEGRHVAGEAVIAALGQAADPDDIVVADTGYMAAWACNLYTVQAAGRGFLCCRGSLGWSFPAALGAQLARPDRQVFCVTGDGGFGYHVGDLETAVRLDLPVVVLVLNNSCLAFEHQVQTYLYGGEIVSEVNDFHDTDYGAVARAFGADGVRVETRAELDQALAGARARRRPTVIDIVTDREQVAPVTTFEAMVPRAY